MQVLQQQINPHFLLNTLNTFRWMADAQRQHRLSSLLLALSHLLRQQIYHDRSHWTVEEELAYISRYIEIQRARFGESFEVSLEADPASRPKTILKMLVQPLVENCFEHAFRGRRRGVVRIAFRSDEGGGLRIAVEDDGVGFGNAAPSRKDRASIGLDNVRNRLQLHYGEEARLATENVPGGGARVTIVISGRGLAHEHSDRG
jgi:sensor histidine kinase YesM